MIFFFMGLIHFAKKIIMWFCSVILHHGFDGLKIHGFLKKMGLSLIAGWIIIAFGLVDFVAELI